MSKKSALPRRHVEHELALLRAAPQVQSVASLERGEKLLEQYHDELSADDALYVLRLCASGCQAAGRWLEGLKFSRRGIELAVRNRKLIEKIPFLAISGNIHSFLGNLHLAVRSMREALLIAEQQQLVDDQIKLLQGLGPMYSRMDMHAEALALYARAFELSGNDAAAPMRMGALNNMARSYCAMGQLERAGQHIEAALGISDAQGSTEWRPHLLHSRAEILAAEGKFELALLDAAAATALLRERKNVPVLLRVLVDSAGWMQACGDFDGARASLIEAAALPQESSLYELREEIALAEVKLHRACNQLDQALDALDSYLAARADRQQIRLDSQRVATQFVEDVERTEARGRRESAALNELTLRLIETQAEAQRMARLGARDPLTGVLNRAAFEAAAERVADGTQQPASLMMLDIDNFRAVNTEHGHLAGDAVLEAVVERIRQALRTHDLIGRFGGDEFLILCPGVGPRTGAAIAGRVLSRVSVDPIPHETNSIKVTVSMGVASAHTNALATLPYLIKRADAALRRAKLSGKNRAVTVRVNG